MGTIQNIANLFLGSGESRTPVYEQADHLYKYNQAYQTGSYLMLSFAKADAITGALSTIDGDVTVIMPADQISGKRYELRFRAQKLDDTYCVKVIGIDNATKQVMVSHHAARLEQRPEIEKELQKCLDGREVSPIIVKGKVLKIQSKMADGETIDTGVWLDLCGVGVPGFIYIGDWHRTFTQTLRGKAAYGDIIDVLVKKKVERERGMYYYACSRQELVQDPWESKELSDKYHKGDIVKIRCLVKKENHWFGQINGLEDIQVFAEYPSERHRFPIVPGMEYMGTIYYINTKEHSLKARVFQALSLESIAEEDVLNSEETNTIGSKEE